MHRFVYLSAMLIFLGTLLIPFSVSALGLSWGGRITYVHYCQNGTIWIIETSARLADPGTPESYIWAPGSVTYSDGPPNHVGQEILGVADAPIPCVLNYYPYVQVMFPRMQILGTSPM